MRPFLLMACALLEPLVLDCAVLAQAASPELQDMTSAQLDAEAQRQFDRGTQLYQTRQLSAAIDAFTASYRLVPTANVAFNIAQTAELVGKLEEAFNWYQACASFDDDDTASIARDRSAALLSQIAALEVRLDPGDATLTIDGAERAQDARSPRTFAVSPGQHELQAKGPGRSPQHATVEARRGRVVALAFHLEPLPGTLAIKTTPNGASVFLRPDMTPLGITPLSIQLPVVEADLSLRLRGYKDEEVIAPMRSASVTMLSLDLVPLPPGGRRVLPPRVTARRPVPTREPPESGIGVWNWVGYGTAAALLGTGCVLGVLALDRRADVAADPERRGKDALTRLNLATDLTIGSALLIAAVTFALDLSVHDLPLRSADAGISTGVESAVSTQGYQ